MIYMWCSVFGATVVTPVWQHRSVALPQASDPPMCARHTCAQAGCPEAGGRAGLAYQDCELLSSNCTIVPPVLARGTGAVAGAGGRGAACSRCRVLAHVSCPEVHDVSGPPPMVR